MRSTSVLAGAVLLVSSALLSPPAHAAPSRPATLSEAVGPEIDASERDRYRLFPDISEFESARLIELDDGGYRLEFVRRGPSGPETKSRKISAEAMEQTRLHVALAEAYWSGLAAAPADSVGEAEILRRLSLRYASQARYDIASAIASDLRTAFPETGEGRWASESVPGMESMAKRHRALIWPGSLLDQRGRTDLLVFSGYYGLWLGIAIPVAFEAEDAQAYAAGLLVTPALCILLANQTTKDANITKGQATMISLGGHLGAWQGMGWSGMAEADGNAVVGAGVLAGLGGIAAAIPIAKAGGFSEGHAAITSSAMHWGGWFGAVFGVLANHDQTQDNGVLSDMLLGSDAAVLGAGIAARKVRLSEKRMRLINLAGVLGTAMGFGFDLLLEVDEEEPIFAIAGAGSLAGLALGASLTRTYDLGKDLATAEVTAVGAGAPRTRRTTLRAPLLSVRKLAVAEGRPVPTLSVRVDF